MKLIELIQRRCNIEIFKFEVSSKLGKDLILDKKPKKGIKPLNACFHVQGFDIAIYYIADSEINSENLSIVKDYFELYVDSIISYQMTNHLNASQDIFSGRSSFDEFVKVTMNSLVYSGLFDKVAFMLYNRYFKRARGVYIAGVDYDSKAVIPKFKNVYVEVPTDIFNQISSKNDSNSCLDRKDFIFKELDNIPHSNTILVCPLASGERLTGLLALHSTEDYSIQHTYTAKTTAKLLNTMMLAYISNVKYEYTLNFYKDMESEIKASQNLATLGNYVATIAHEVRSPLVSIGGFAKHISKSINKTDLKKMASIIESESSRLEHLTTDILTFSNKHAVKKEKVKLTELLSSITPLFEKRCESNNFQIEIKDIDNISISIDLNQLKQVIVNLITNAMNAMKENGKVTIFADSNDNYIFIHIRDTGPGIPDNIAEDIFKPFFTTSQEGTGLGLPISKKILMNHSGDLLFNNVEGGAEFILMLPKE